MELPLNHPMNCLCHSLRRAARQATQIYDKAIRPAGIRATQFSLLATLEELGGTDGTTITKLADQMGMDRTTLTRNLSLAETSNWVSVRQGDDLRERVITLTSPGRRKLHEAMPLWKAAQKHALKQFGQKNISDLLVIARSISTE